MGDLLGGARIERIEDSAIVVRNGRQLQRLPLFVGVVKTPVAEALPRPISVPVPVRETAPTAALGASNSSPGPGPGPSAPPAGIATRTAQAVPACNDRLSCMQRSGPPR